MKFLIILDMIYVTYICTYMYVSTFYTIINSNIINVVQSPAFYLIIFIHIVKLFDYFISKADFLGSV